MDDCSSPDVNGSYLRFSDLLDFLRIRGTLPTYPNPNGVWEDSVLQSVSGLGHHGFSRVDRGKDVQEAVVYRVLVKGLEGLWLELGDKPWHEDECVVGKLIEMREMDVEKCKEALSSSRREGSGFSFYKENVQLAHNAGLLGLEGPRWYVFNPTAGGAVVGALIPGADGVVVAVPESAWRQREGSADGELWGGNLRYKMVYTPAEVLVMQSAVDTVLESAVREQTLVNWDQ